MSKKIGLILCILSVFAAIFILVGAKFKNIGHKFLVSDKANNVHYGDLYNLSGLNDFKLPIPILDFTSTTTLEEAEVITLGDSFFQAKFETKNVPDLLADNLDKKVFDSHEILGNPLVYLAKHNYQKSRPKIVIVETVERYAVKRMASYNEKISSDNKSDFKQKINDIAFKIFDQSNLNYFFKYNIFINPLKLWLRNLEFKTLGITNHNISRYSIDPPMLFYFEEVEFNTNKHLDKNLDKYAQNVKNLKDTLKNKYNLDMIYVIIPNKYTIYSHLDKNGSYNDFIPKIQSELNKQGIDYVDLYSLYNQYTKTDNAKLLYYPNETHFTAKAKEILVDELTKKIREKK